MSRRAGEHRVGLLAQEDPPANTRADSMTAKVLALVPELRGHLGEWYRIAEAHSEKPPLFADLVERMSPGPYVELFARAPRLGWDSWGHGYELPPAEVSL